MFSQFFIKNDRRAVLFLAAALLGTALSGCGRQEIRVERIPKANAPAPTSQPHLHWKTPEGWREEAPTQVRLGSFKVPGADGVADVSIVAFPSPAGTDLANVNRWRGELALPPIAESELKSEAVAIGSQQGKLFEMVSNDAVGESKQKVRTIAALFDHAGMAWFFKMRGDDATVTNARGGFLKLLESIEFDTSDHSAVPVASQVSANSGEMPSAQERPAIAPKSSVELTLPVGWKEQTAGAMVLRSFTVTNAIGGALLNVSVFPGDMGGPLAIVNLWRGQLGLNPISADELPKQVTSFDVPGGKAMLSDIAGVDAGSGRKARMLAAMLPRKGQTWFYKMTGDEAAMVQQREALLEMVRTAKYSDSE